MIFRFKQIAIFALLGSAASLFAFSAAAREVTITGDQFALEQVNWDGSSHRAGPAKVGGYMRNPLTAYDYESLVSFNVSELGGTVLSATLRFQVNGGATAGPQTVELYQQDIAPAWDRATVSYNSFNDGPYSSPGWSNLLGAAQVDAAVPETVEIASDALADLVQAWIDNPATNAGVVLTGVFWYFGYYVDVNWIQLVVTTDEPEWHFVGGPTILDFDPEGAIDAVLGPEGHIYVAAKGKSKTCDDCLYNAPHVFRFDGDEWEDLDPEGLLPDGPVDSHPWVAVEIEVLPDGTPLVATTDTRTRFYTFNGSTWDFVTITPDGYNPAQTLTHNPAGVAVGPDGTIWTVLLSDIPGPSWLFWYDGAGWDSEVVFAVPERLTVAVGADGNPVMVQELNLADGTKKLQAWRYDGSTVQLLGSLFNPAQLIKEWQQAVASDGTPYVTVSAYGEGQHYTNVYTFDGTDWDLVGQSGDLGSSIAIDIAVSADDTLYASYNTPGTYSHSYGAVARWDGAAWSNVSVEGFWPHYAVYDSIMLIGGDDLPIVAWVGFSSWVTVSKYE